MKKEKLLIKTLVYGYGNIKNHDKGVASEMIARLTSWASDNFIFDVDLKSKNKLSLVDIELVSHYTRVIFVESKELIDDSCELIKLKSSEEYDRSPALEYSPQFILNECSRIYNRNPQCYHLKINGKDWTFEEGISEFASMNLDTAELFLRSILRNSILHKPILKHFKLNKGSINP